MASQDNVSRSKAPNANDSHIALTKGALVTGITGHDGSYLTKFLLRKGYQVHGLIRRSSNYNTQQINHIYVDPHNANKARMKLHYADLSDASSLRRWLDVIKPDEVYNLDAQSHVDVSFEIPDYTANVVATGGLRLLEAVRSHMADNGRNIKYYQACSSEVFESTPPPQSQDLPMMPPNAPLTGTQSITEKNTASLPGKHTGVTRLGFAGDYMEAMGRTPWRSFLRCQRRLTI
ncbi:unnamed protein product [Brassica oleracea]